MTVDRSPETVDHKDHTCCGCDALDHDDFHAAFGRALERQFVHEAANEKDAAAAGLEEVFGGTAIGERRRIEAAAFVPHANGDARRGVRRQRRELDVHALLLVVAVAVLDGVDHRLADRDADPVQRLVIEACLPADVVGHHLDEIEHVEGAAEVETDGVSPGHRSDGFDRTATLGRVQLQRGGHWDGYTGFDVHS